MYEYMQAVVCCLLGRRHSALWDISGFLRECRLWFIVMWRFGERYPLSAIAIIFRFRSSCFRFASVAVIRKSPCSSDLCIHLLGKTYQTCLPCVRISEAPIGIRHKHRSGCCIVCRADNGCIFSKSHQLSFHSPLHHIHALLAVSTAPQYRAEYIPISKSCYDRFKTILQPSVSVFDSVSCPECHPLPPPSPLPA